MSEVTKDLKSFPKSPLGEKIEGLPSGRDVEWVSLVDFRRNGVSENTIHGAISWYSGDECIHSFGGNVLCYGRSMMKPFYIKVFSKRAKIIATKSKKPFQYLHIMVAFNMLKQLNLFLPNRVAINANTPRSSPSAIWQTSQTP